MKTLSRITKHKNPKYQLYQYGFNHVNGCWLAGSWVTLPKDEWKARKSAHEKLYANVTKEVETQCYRNPGVKPEDMTPAQRQAWQHFSGQSIVTIVTKDGHSQMVSLSLSGDQISQADLNVLRKSGDKIAMKTKAPSGEIESLPYTGVPAELQADITPDPWQEVHERNRKVEDEMMDSMLSMSGKLAVSECPEEFGQIMAAQCLISQEEGIIRNEWDESRGIKDRFFDKVQQLARYASARQKLKAALSVGFDAVYQQVRGSHNECARANLDNSKGTLYCYVLPKFNDDGTHEPYGEKDVPWGQKEEKVCETT